MVDTVPAAASPEKRLFVYLITRDISLADAVLDLIDNSINAALQPLAEHLNTADDYQQLLARTDLKPNVRIDLKVGATRILVNDTAQGISLEDAQNDVFRFGRGENGEHASDRLSVYGIGLKRAMFKCGNKIHIVSEHRDGGFELRLNARRWEQLVQEQWQFDILPRKPAKKDFGTRIVITELHDDVVRRLQDGIFVSQLRERITRTYSFFIDRVVSISLNGDEIESESFEIGENYTSEKFTKGKVSCNVTAGLASSRGKVFREKNSGWHVFCNGRTVLFADKSPITGWGSGLATFQPKHRPFLGTVFFVSPDPEALPWTTTKGGINEEDAVWQQAKRHMITVGREITSFLDSRYSEDDTRISPAELQDASRGGISVLTAAVSNERKFEPPRKARAGSIKIQYDAKTADVERIEKYLRRPGMGGSAVGRYTFRHFLKNEVGEE